MTDINKDQIAYWNGDMAERWLKTEAQLDEVFETPLAEIIRIANAQPGESVLDVGCGSGASTFPVARQVAPVGKVVGIDVSQPMLARAKQHLATTGLNNVSFVKADAQTHAFEAQQFDLIFSRFGVMFFDDPVAAFRNLGETLKLGGRLAVMAWGTVDDNNPWFSVPRDITIAKVGPTAAPADPFAPSPFAFADVDRVTGILERAGLNDVEGQRIETELKFDDSERNAAEMMVLVGPAARLLREHNASPEIVQAVQRELARQLERFRDGNTLRIPATVTVFTARRG